jgi:hypothetical protein
MEKQNTAYQLENNMRASFEKYPTRTLKVLIDAATAIKNNAGKKLKREGFIVGSKTDNIHLHIMNDSIFVTYKNVFGYEFLYNEEEGEFKVLPFVHWSLNSIFDKNLELVKVETFHEEMQNEIDNDAYLSRWIKAVIDCALMPADTE